MAPRRGGALAALGLAACLLLLARCPAAAESDRLAELIARQRRSKDAVISLSSNDFERYALAPGARDYDLVVFLNAREMASNKATQLPKLRGEFALAAQAYRRGPAPHAVFFVELYHESSTMIFARLNVRQLPYAFHWAKTAVAKDTGSIKIPKSSTCGARIKTYPWPAEDVAAWVAGLSGVAGGEIDRPSLLKHPLFPLALLGGIVAGGAAGWRLYNSPIVRITGLWTLGALGVYWFATSGGMYNIIRGIPLYYTNREGKTIYWMEGRQGQLGAEGFIMGSSYIFFSATLASLTYVVPRIVSPSGRAVASLALVLLAAATAMRILEAYKSKSGLGMRHFFRI